MDRINGLGVDDLAQRSAEQLVAVLRDNAEPHGLGAGFGGRVALTDNMIHQQDIRRPLGIARTIPVERLCAALDFVRFSPTIRGAWLARGRAAGRHGLRLVLRQGAGGTGLR